MTYNVTELYAADSFVDLVIYANNSTSSVLASLFVIAVFIVILLALRLRSDFVDSLLVSSFVCFILSMFLTWATLLNFMFPLFFLAVLAFGVLYVFVTR